MQISFQTPTYCFEADFNDTPLAKSILESLPLDSQIAIAKDKIYFKTQVKTAVAQATDIIDVGDVVYSLRDESICVYFSPVQLAEDNLVVHIGKTEIDPVEIGRIKEGEPIRIMKIAQTEQKQEAASAIQPDYSSQRKLSQKEIDALVQLILAKKRQGG